MATTFRDVLEFRAALAEMAEEVRLKIISMSEVERAELVTRLIAHRDMVFGVWPDADQAGGFGMQVISGQGLMPPLKGFDLAKEVTVGAIPCAGPEQAIAAREAWGSNNNDQEPEDPKSAQVALSVAEVARLIWISGRRAAAGGAALSERPSAAGPARTSRCAPPRNLPPRAGF
jgi:hypothetical protein